MERTRFGFYLAALAIALTTNDSQAQSIPAGVIQPIAAQRIDSDEGNLPTGFLENGDRFGRSVITIGDLDQDGVKDLAVGARSDDDGGVDAGAVYILFMNADLTVKSATKISATFGGLGAGVLDAGDFFGYSLASDGDLNNDGIQDLIVGAPNDDDGNDDAGAIYTLFLDRSGSVQGFQKISNTSGRLTPGNVGTPLAEDDNFGTAAGLIGDFNNDGFPDVAIGAPHDDDGGTNFGALWLMSIEQDGSAASPIKISNTDLPPGMLSANDQFGGRHVANIGDLDGDGRGELAVGAFKDDDGVTDAGALYTLFFNEDLSVRDIQKISALEGGLDAALAFDDLFGMTVAPLGDLDGDGVPDIAVGNNKDDDGGEDRGAVFFLLLNSDGTVKAEAKVSSTGDYGFDALDLLDGDRLGRALGFVGDMAGNGSQVLALGAGAGIDGGAIWLLEFETLGSILLGDCNMDGVVDFLDISPFISILSGVDYVQEADVNQDGVVNFLDISPFVNLLLSS